MSFYRFPVTSPVKVLMLFLGILVLGYISYERLTISLFPNIKSPKITVVVETEGLSPEEIERIIIERVERSLITLRRVKDLVTIARADTALATVTFEWGADMDFALLDVKKAVGDLAQDEHVKEITTLQYDPNSLPIYTMALYGGNLETMHRLADDVFKPTLERMEGVAIARITGGVQKEVAVYVDENLMLSNKLSLDNVQNALKTALIETSGGWVEKGSERLMLKMVSDRSNLQALGASVVGYNQQLPIYLRDIAEVQIVDKEPESLVRINGKPGVGISLYKEIDANTVRVVESIQKQLEELKAGLPEDVLLETAYDQSIFLRQAIDELRNSAIIGMVLAMLVLIAFLRNIPSTLICSLAIPMSIVATFNFMYFQDITFNLMSLGGLAIGVGMLVDDAIVALESIYTKRQEGMPLKLAAEIGTQEVGAAIIASTLTTVVVFLPIVFLRGVSGLLFKEFALTVISSLMASLLVALLLVPMLASRYLHGKVGGMGEDPTPGATGQPPRSMYRNSLQWALRARLPVIGVAVATFVVALVLASRIPQEFMPKTDEGQVVLRLRMPPGTRIEITAAAAEQVERVIQSVGIAYERIYTRIGVGEEDSRTQGEEVEGANTAEIVLTLKPVKAGGVTSSVAIAKIQPGVKTIPGLETQYVMEQGELANILSTSGAPIVVELESNDLEKLSLAAAQVKQSLEAEPRLHNVSANILEGNPEARVDLDEDLMAGLGFTVESVASAVRSRLQGSVATSFQGEAEEMDVRLRLRQIDEQGVEHLKHMRLRSAQGREATLNDLAKIEFAKGNQEIVRHRQKRVARVEANIKEGELSDAVNGVRASVSEMRFPSGVLWRLAGEEEQRMESFNMLLFAFGLAFVLVYMVLASILESIVQPFTIMLTIPLAAIGVVVAFLLSGETMNLMGYIGIVMLVGIVVKNAIVMLDYVNQLRARGIERTEALLLAGQRRLRPILMTTLTTVLGILPLVFGLGEGAKLQRPLALAVFGGLTSSTILTLYVIPIVYTWVDDAGLRLGAALKRISRRS